MKILGTNLYIALFLFFYVSNCFSKEIKVAVIDTGIDNQVGKICKDGNIDFSGTNSNDSFGHGTHIAGLIIKNAKNANFCLYNLKYYDPAMHGGDSLKAIISALKKAIDLNVDIINISAGGFSSVEEEKSLIKLALDKGIKVIVAAGNEATNLDKDCNYFPACYDNRLIVVGNLTKTGVKSNSSNYGSIVKTWEIGTNVVSSLPNQKSGELSGTSQATAIFTGKTLNSMQR
jgi:subtilisin family serine protease